MISYILALLLLFPIVLVSGMLALVYARRQAPNANFLLGYLVGGLLVAASYALELIQPSLPAKMFWHSVYYLGAVVSYPFFLCFALRYKRSDFSFSPAILAAIFVPGGLMFLLQATNQLHHLFYQSVYLDTSGALPAYLKINGPLYAVSQLWLYGYTLAAVAILLSAWRQANGFYRLQTLIVVASVLLPTVANLLYLFKLRPWGMINITPFSVIITGMVCTWAVLHYQLLDLMPVAYSLVFAKIPFGVVVLDERQRIVDINPTAQTDFGVTYKQIIGQSLELLSLENKTTFRALLDQTPPVVQELSLVEAGKERIFLVEQATFKYQKNQCGRIILLRDISRRKELERNQVEQRRKTDLLEERERLSNDLHDGLGSVMGYASLQIESALLNLGSGEINGAQATLARLAEVTREAQSDLRLFILGMRQADEKEQSVMPESPAMNLGDALASYCEQFSAQFGLPVKLSLPGGVGSLDLPPDRENHLLRILKEALTNIRAHAQASHARVTLFLDPEAIELIVEDDGRGFDPQQAFQEDESSGAQQGHFGLQIMRARATEMGGSLEIRSTPAKGASLILRVPRPSRSPLPKLSALSVLLVDDHPLFRVGLRNLLTARGMQVVGEASNGEMAIQLAERLHPNLVLMDCRMPGMPGVEAVRQIKSSLPETYVVMLTVEEDQDMLHQALHAGASGYLLKDMKPEEFFIMLESLTRGEIPISSVMAARLISQAAKSVAASEPGRLRDRQVKILELALQGLTNQEIGERLSLSESSIKYQLRQIFDILHVRSRDEALAVAQKRGLIH